MRDFYLCLILIFSFGVTYAQDGKDEYDDLVKLMEGGKCVGQEYVAKDSRRLASLLFLEDVLLSVRGHEGYVRDFVGDIDNFKIGRSVDPTLVKLYSYSTRKDVAAQIDKDIEGIKVAIGGYIPDANEQEGRGLLTALFCNIGGMLAGEEYHLKGELDSYFNSLNRKIMRANVERLNDIVDGL